MLFVVDSTFDVGIFRFVVENSHTMLWISESYVNDSNHVKERITATDLTGSVYSKKFARKNKTA